MLPVREFAQRQTLERFEVFYDFQFRDAQPESGITFQNQITPDSAMFYQPNHYDHGNGIAVADVDGDELFDIYFVTQLGRNELWRNLGQRSLRGHHREGRRLSTIESAPPPRSRTSTMTATRSFVTTVSMGNVFFRKRWQRCVFAT